jgi:hypothetical protein
MSVGQGETTGTCPEAHFGNAGSCVKNANVLRVNVVRFGVRRRAKASSGQSYDVLGQGFLLTLEEPGLHQINCGRG